MKKKQTFTNMLNGLIENGLTVIRYESPDSFGEDGARANIDIYIDESKFHHYELYMIPDDMIKLLKDIFVTDFICLFKYLFQMLGETPSKQIVDAAIKKVQDSMNICRVYDVDPEKLEKSKKATKALFDDLGSRLDSK